MSQSFDQFIFQKVAEEMVSEHIKKEAGLLKYTSIDLGLRNSPYVRMVSLPKFSRKKNGKG
jgi:hypothetical protein